MKSSGMFFLFFATFVVRVSPFASFLSHVSNLNFQSSFVQLKSHLDGNIGITTTDAGIFPNFYTQPNETSTSVATIIHREETKIPDDKVKGNLGIDILSYLTDRISYNIELQLLLSKGQQASVISHLHRLKCENIELNVDTVHILISDSFLRKDSNNVEQLFLEYFQSKILVPTSRTLNILMDGYRILRDEIKVYYYRDCFKYYNLPLDSYSYSTLIRVAKTSATVTKIIGIADSRKSLSSPLLRCAIESLGKLGDPWGAVKVAGRMLTISNTPNKYNSYDESNLNLAEDSYRKSLGYSSVYDCRASGDSLLVALLENPSNRLISLVNNYGDMDKSSDRFNDNAYNVTTQRLDDSGNDKKTRDIDNDNNLSNEDGYNSNGRWHFLDEDSEYRISSRLKKYGVSELEKMLTGMTCGDAAISLALLGAGSVIDINLSRWGNTGTHIEISSEGDTVEPLSNTSEIVDDDNRDERVNILPLISGSKGWCKMFTFLQRNIKEVLEDLEKNKNNKSKHTANLSAEKLKKLREVRNMLLAKLLTEFSTLESQLQEVIEMEGSTDVVLNGGSAITLIKKNGDYKHSVESDIITNVVPSISIGSSSYTKRRMKELQANNIELNGRLSDSVLRCYVEDAEKAKKMWKNTLLPLAKKIAKINGDEKAFKEICEKSLEALMFISGFNSRADLGFEIALTARKRDWTNEVRRKLGKSYAQGKMQSRGYESQWLKSNILNDGLERSIESELGVQLLDFYYDVNNKKKKNDWPIQRIRIQLNDNTV